MFRPSNKNSGDIIIAKFKNRISKKIFIISYFKYKKLCLNDLDFNSDKRIFINDSLPKPKRVLFAEARKLLNNHLIKAAVIKRGEVMVKIEEGDELVICTHELISSLKMN